MIPRVTPVRMPFVHVGVKFANNVIHEVNHYTFQELLPMMTDFELDCDSNVDYGFHVDDQNPHSSYRKLAYSAKQDNLLSKRNTDCTLD